jgi:hypothetical protein
MSAAPSSGIIELRLDDPVALFEPLEVSPFSEKHLNEKVEQFILHCAREEPTAEFTIVMHFPAGTQVNQAEPALLASIPRHFAHRAREEAGRIRSLIREATRDLMAGLVFLFLCGLAGVAALKLFPGPIGLFVEQGLLILGWVALWRPVDLFLYELRPLRNTRNLMSALGRAQVRLGE